jgi:hypothetical protein
MFSFSQTPFSVAILDFFNGKIVDVNISLEKKNTHALSIIKTQDIVLELNRHNPIIL